ERRDDGGGDDLHLRRDGNRQVDFAPLEARARHQRVVLEREQCAEERKDNERNLTGRRRGGDEGDLGRGRERQQDEEAGSTRERRQLAPNAFRYRKSLRHRSPHPILPGGYNCNDGATSSKLPNAALSHLFQGIYAI